MILLDASGLFAALDRRQPQHQSVRLILEASRGPFVLSPFVLAETDYLVLKHSGVEAELTFLGDVAAGAYELADFTDGDVRAAAEVAATYREHEIGLADASIVVLAGRYANDRVLTLDERHFRALRTPAGRPFTILPADA